MARTLRDHVVGTAVRVVGGDDDLAPRRERMLALVVDGRPIGDYELTGDKELLKRLNEMQALGHALVGAELDYMVIEVRSLDTRHGAATTDFEADLRDGQKVKIELARLSDESEKKYINALGQIGHRAEVLIAKRTSFEALIGNDTIHVRFYDGAPSAKEISTAATELAGVVCSAAPGVRPSTKFYKVPAQYPVLSRLGAHWARARERHPARIMMQPMRSVIRPQLAATFDTVVQKKSRKAADYGADGLPVWLVLYGESSMTFSLGAVQEIASRKDFDCGPFERVIIGCFTAGVVFEKGCSPRYVNFGDD